MKQIDTGGLSFPELRRRDKYYVDKTLLIKDILDHNDSGIYLFTRPRRFGKTTNLSMMDAFFNIEYRGNTWFDDLVISKYPEFEQYKNAFPVIFINLKEAKESNYGFFIDRMRAVLYNTFDRHRAVLKSRNLDEDQRAIIQKVLSKTVEEPFIRDCIPLLCRILEEHHGRKPVVLIDEYDRPIADSFGSESHRPIMDFLGEFMNSAIKNNENLQMAYVTGVMQIPKESMFSDLNNIDVNNVFSKASDERFGFTDSEVKAILSDYGHPEKFDEVKRWYDGYRFGDAEVYNPFSIMNYVSKGFEPAPYWVNMGGDGVIRRLLQRIGGENFDDIMGLIEGGCIRTRLMPSLRYAAADSDDLSLYSLMAMAGYLRAVPAGDGLFDISLPNAEVKGLLEELMYEMKPISDSLFLEFNRAVIDRDADRMASTLQTILLDASYLNLDVENAYGLVLMTIMHALAKRYDVKTEYEAGNGRTDIMLRPREDGTVPMIFELKRVRSEDALDAGLDEAMAQIHDRRYYLGMTGKVVLIAASFYKKIPKVRIEVIDVGNDLRFRRSPPAVSIACYFHF